ncbi:uracil phosphoribosyltransferase, partial [Metarhizium majus ARSEF 297]
MPSKDMSPTVIGLYGLPECAKSFLLNELKKHLSHSEHREEIPPEELARWQQAEIDQLSHVCQRHGILFSRLPERSQSHIATILKIIQFSSLFITEVNATRVDAKVNNFLADHAELETVVVVDADRTLSAEDTGVMFWQYLDLRQPSLHALKVQDCPLFDLFSGPLGCSTAAFLQATLLYEEAANEEDFERISSHDYVRVLVVTCGIRRVWEKIRHREGFSRTIQVIGGSRISDGVLVMADAKAQVVARLRNQENLRILAIGESPLDLPMLEAASEAIVVTGDEHTRSRSMNDALLEAIKTRNFKARQTLLPSTVSPRLSDALLPQVCLNSDEFRGSLFFRQRGCLYSALWQATGIEEYQMQHVQGHTISGYRLKHEKKTTIAALMRGGGPMALGISDALPSAVFVHVKIPDDITTDHLDGQKTVILVDSVINSRRTMIQFIQHIRTEHKDIRIVVVAGVVQAETIVRGHAFTGAMQDHGVFVGALHV